MDNTRAVEEITKLLPMTGPSGQLPPTCQRALDLRSKNWEAALLLIDKECYSPSWDDAHAQAMSVEGTIWHARDDLERALTQYQLACGDFRLRRNAVGEAVMYIAMGMIYESTAWGMASKIHTFGAIVHNLAALGTVCLPSALGMIRELNGTLTQAQNAYQEARTRFQGICSQPIGHDDVRLRDWCRKAARILDARLESARPQFNAQHERSPRWIPRLEVAAAGDPQRYALQEWERIHYKTTGHIQIQDTTYELEPVTRKTRRQIKPDSAADYFITKAQGTSMIDAGIRDGDLLLVQVQPQPATGQIVVVELESEVGGVTLVKQIRYDGQWIHLESANLRFPARTFKRDAPRLRILGTVLAVLKKVPTDDNDGES